MRCGKDLKRIIMKADIDDLVLERWLRARDRGEIVWITKSGDEIPINKMTDSHLENAINMIRKKNEFNDAAAEYDAYFGI